MQTLATTMTATIVKAFQKPTQPQLASIKKLKRGGKDCLSMLSHYGFFIIIAISSASTMMIKTTIAAIAGRKY